jgi:hypothetical protein
VEAAAGSQDRRLELRGRKKTFRAHFVVAEHVILVGSSRKSIFHYFRVYDGLSEAFWSSKADFQSLVFICASDFLSHEAASKHKQTLP